MTAINLKCVFHVKLMQSHLSDSVHMVNLGPETVRDGSEIMLTDGRLVLQMRLSHHFQYQQWQIVLSDPTGKVVFRNNFQPDDSRLFTLTLNHAWFDVPGEYSVEIIGFGGDQTEILDSLKLKIQL